MALMFEMDRLKKFEFFKIDWGFFFNVGLVLFFLYLCLLMSTGTGLIITLDLFSLTFSLVPVVRSLFPLMISRGF